jgi:hypothetical protein
VRKGEEGVVSWRKGGGFVDGISPGFVFCDMEERRREGESGG